MDNANDFDIFFRNMGKALEILGSLRSSYIYRFANGGAFAMGTRTPAADENWAWVYGGNYTRPLLTDIVKKYAERSAPFVWPVFFGASGALGANNAQMEDDMEKLGMTRRAAHSAMVFSSATDSYSYAAPALALSSKRALSLQDIFLWGDVCWRGFTDENEPSAPAEFIMFARHAALDDKIRLITGYAGGEPAGAYMLCHCDANYVSHFSVLPKWRGQGVGDFLMDEIMKNGKSLRKRNTVLLSTAAGEKLYGRFGFRKVADVHLRSFSEL